ncbi:MAG TPA: NAD(P)/FAD-dependent oxidoreductase [Actinoplanes sp.]|nr:NAD(P)/FAD-dependent oxidoreductase [Actinoplanes sp.]
MTETRYDVVVVGGGAAGLSGALALARARRRVLVVDAGQPRNAPASGVHNYLGREGVPPADLLATGRAEVAGYGGEVVAGTVTGATPDGDGFLVSIAGGGKVHTRRLLVTTGIVDELPAVPGLAERWGHTVLHCPYCHGWEMRDQPVGVLSTGPMAVHQGLLWTQWTADVTFFLHTGPALSEQERAQLAARGVRFVEGEVVALEGDADVRLAGGALVPRRALVVTPRFTARSDVLESLGLHPVEHELGIGTRIPADPVGATALPGVWVAGNVTDPMAQVVKSAAAGFTAGAALNAELIQAETAERLAHAGSAAAAG